MRRFLVLAIVAVLAACGSSGGGESSTTEGRKYVDAITTRYRNGSSKVFTTNQARCIAEKEVDAIGVATLKRAGVTPAKISDARSGSTLSTIGDKLTEQQARDLADALTGGECFNFTDLVVKALSKSDATFRALGTTKAHCLFEKLLADSSFEQAMVNSILGRETSSDAFNKAFSNKSKLFTILGECKIKPSQLNG